MLREHIRFVRDRLVEGGFKADGPVRVELRQMTVRFEEIRSRIAGKAANAEDLAAVE